MLGCVHRPRYRVCLTIIYACGLRLLEGVHLQVKDIDGERQVLHIHQGKGNKDRCVPLPSACLKMLRQHWLTHRNPLWLFPSPFEETHQPMSDSGMQRAFAPRCKRVGFTNKPPCIPCATRMPRIYWKPGSICALSRVIWDTPRPPPPHLHSPDFHHRSANPPHDR